MEKRIYLVCEASWEEYKKGAEDRVKNNDMDCYVQISNMYAFKTKEEAIKECRKFNNDSRWDVHFIQEIPLY